jgi:hypothetical protein
LRARNVRMEESQALRLQERRERARATLAKCSDAEEEQLATSASLVHSCARSAIRLLLIAQLLIPLCLGCFDSATLDW